MAPSAMCTPASAGLEHGGGVDAAGVVGVEVDGDADLLAQGLDQLFGGVGPAQAGHVLDGQDVRAHALQLLGHADVVVERILVALGVEDVAGVADGGFADGVGLAHGLHGRLHVGQPVQRIEDAEDVDALGGGFVDEFAPPRCRDRRCSRRRWRRAAASGNRCWGWPRASCAQAGEGVFVQEAHGDVEGGAAPHFQAEEIVQAVRDEVGDGQHVVGADARGQQRLVGVAEGGVGEEQALLFARPIRRGLPGRVRCRSLARALRAARQESCGGTARGSQARGTRLAGHCGIAVDDHVAQIGEQLGGAVAARGEAEQRGSLFEPAGGDVAGLKIGGG